VADGVAVDDFAVAVVLVVEGESVVVAVGLMVPVAARVAAAVGTRNDTPIRGKSMARFWYLH